MDYEGLYRKSGGAGQTKTVTQLFEKGNYDSFDLTDPDLINDISSITSTLKSYFRALPNPLFTYELHEGFIDAGSLKEPPKRVAELTTLLEDLPKEHYETIKYLMLHLHEYVVSFVQLRHLISSPECSSKRVKTRWMLEILGWCLVVS
jgi:hypothetical protein